MNISRDSPKVARTPSQAFRSIESPPQTSACLPPLQGAQGYRNPEILPGDRLLAVDGGDVSCAAVEVLRAALRGQPDTVVALRLAPAAGGTTYVVRVLRHATDPYAAAAAEAATASATAWAPPGPAGVLPGQAGSETPRGRLLAAAPPAAAAAGELPAEPGGAEGCRIGAKGERSFRQLFRELQVQAPALESRPARARTLIHACA